MTFFSYNSCHFTLLGGGNTHEHYRFQSKKKATSYTYIFFHTTHVYSFPYGTTPCLAQKRGHVPEMPPLDPPMDT